MDGHGAPLLAMTPDGATILAMMGWGMPGRGKVSIGPFSSLRTLSLAARSAAYPEDCP
jgi:hypothetical protein